MALCDSLPIDSIIPALAAALENGKGAVVVAPPGAGKTTRVPPALAMTSFLASGRRKGDARAVMLLQPRRVAARAAAARIASEHGWKMGREVGYQIRFENRTSPDTLLRVVTEGILTRRIQSDPFLEGISCVILDEFHERSIHTDLALAMLREIQATAREDLRIVVMSATMDPKPVAEFLGGVPIFQSEGRLYPVEIEHLEGAISPTAPIWEQTAAQVKRVLSSAAPCPCSSVPVRARPRLPLSPGHVMVFLPGIGEIRRTQALLRDVDADIHILHSSVSNEEQDRALQPSERRKVILATNIAETSLTIDGVRTVIDTGLARVLISDARLGIDRLELRRISRASAAQRAGRAGRTAPGRCIRLWSARENARMAES
ncbi:MAG: helicase-related protein, partial [Candidatus Sumerlaeota bacterium]|nr:helicase-related protein [Candidatus Sumerlaeota bacterium]